MSRLARNRETQLTREEIAAEALRQFTASDREPTVSTLAAALGADPAAIQRRFDSREEIFQAAVELVWEEATAETLKLVPNPLDEAPAKVLVAIGIATRRAWLEHHRLAPYMAASPAPSEFTRNAFALMRNLFDRLALEPGTRDSAFHSYSSFMLGAVLFAAARKSADERLGRGTVAWEEGSLGELAGISATDPVRDEKLFAIGLERLIASFEIKR